MPIHSLQLTNAKIVMGDEIFCGNVSIKAGRINQISPFGAAMSCEDHIPDEYSLNLNKHYLFPGFIDIHCHGGYGSSFMDCTPTDFTNILSFHQQNGTTTMFPTSLSCDNKLLIEFLETYKNFLESNHPLIHMLGGVHLEGPYISIQNAGAQSKNWCSVPDADLNFAKTIINNYSFVKRWTIAPEIDAEYRLAHFLSDHNILVSAGHTNVLYEGMCEAFENGYRHITHLYSGMNRMVSIHGLRKAGAVEAALLHPNVSVELIADGIHLPYPLIELVYRMKGADKIAIVTDAMRGTGTNAAHSILGNRLTGTPVILEDGVAKLPNRSSLAGSITPLIDMFRGLVQNTSIPLTDVVKMCSSTPAHIMNIHHSFGTIQTGYTANLIELDENLNLIAVIQNGIYKKINPA